MFDCPICKHENVPLNYKATYTKGKITLDIYECACCGKVPNIATDIKIKSVVEL